MSDKALSIRDDMTLSELGTILAKSGFFTDTREAGQAIVKVLAGRELGFGPVASMTGINIIQGRVAISANLMAAAVKRSGKYNYRVIEHTEKACEIEFIEAGQPCGRSRFTLEDAKKAGTKNLEKFARNMLFARAMSNGAKWYCPDVFAGPVYTPEEMGAATDENDTVIENVKPIIGNGHKPETVAAADPAGTADEQEQARIEHLRALPETTIITPAPEPFKFAVIQGLTQTEDWRKGCQALAEKYPQYQTVLKGGKPGGQPNFHHIQGAAAKEGYPVINDGNFAAVLEAVSERAIRKAAAADATPA